MTGRLAAVSLGALWSIASVGPLLAQTPSQPYPVKVIRIVIPYGAGAGPDVVARTIGEKMAAGLGQNIVYDNRGGAGGALGTALVAKALSDPVVKQRFDDQGLYGVGSTRQEFAKVIDDEFALNRKLTAVMGIVPQ